MGGVKVARKEFQLGAEVFSNHELLPFPGTLRLILWHMFYQRPYALASLPCASIPLPQI